LLAPERFYYSKGIHYVLRYSQQNLAFNDSAVAQYMNTDFIVLDISLCVALAREQFFEKLKDDDIPSHIFIEDNGRLAGMIAVRKLLQTTDTVQPVRALMISQFFRSNRKMNVPMLPDCWLTAGRMWCRWSPTASWSAA
jgi:hypothetical protein